MPAVKAFALYAAGSLTINFIMQITCFVALMSLDHRRVQNARFDIFCCVEGKKSDAALKPGLIQGFIDNVYVPYLFKPWPRYFVLVIFSIWLCSSIVFIPKIEIGLDQELSMPDDSHVLKYFTHLKSYLSVGPPVYFVLNNTNYQLDFTNSTTQNKICGGQGCNPDSLQSQIKLWSKKGKMVLYNAAIKNCLTCVLLSGNVTYIGSPAQSWLDDYFGWSKDCCRTFTSDGQFCPSDFKEEGSESEDDYYGDFGDFGDFGEFGDSPSTDTTGCENCPSRDSARPNQRSFISQINWFLSDVPGVDCPKAGKAAYSDAVRTNSQNSVGANNFFAFHTVLKTSEDYYEAMRWARRLSNNISQMINQDISDPNLQINVFPYSVFYVFYEQYLTMVEDTVTSLAISLSAVFFVTFVLGGFDIKTAIITSFTILLIVVSNQSLFRSVKNCLLNVYFSRLI